jgi:hypothetical protein
MIPPPPWTIAYADGSANAYRFEATAAGVRFVYDPMTPARSSSGMYSGGDPAERMLSLDDPRIAELWQQVRALEADTAHHASERCKGDGAVTLSGDGATRSFLVVRAATRDLETWLAALR